ncbi:hypothetical protein [Syntrophomonas palmitatica]|uniref:hypothetical protein n=1 Tax=Syntrophomonas palmitatica TaxID=402877 RepID=UPI0012ECE81B|nr:hypothetical protein [Syntrophomonas palmitatica]
MNIYCHELKMSIRSMLYWTLGMILGLWFFMMMFSAVSQDAALISKIASQFPPEVVRAMGLTTLDLTTVLVFTVIYSCLSCWSLRSTL